MPGFEYSLTAAAQWQEMRSHSRIQVKMTWKYLLRAYNLGSFNSVRDFSVMTMVHLLVCPLHLFSAELILMHTNLLTWGILMKAAPGQPFRLWRENYNHEGLPLGSSHWGAAILPPSDGLTFSLPLWRSLILLIHLGQGEWSARWHLPVFSSCFCCVISCLTITLLVIGQSCLPSILQVSIWLSMLLLPMCLAFDHLPLSFLHWLLQCLGWEMAPLLLKMHLLRCEVTMSCYTDILLLQTLTHPLWKIKWFERLILTVQWPFACS